MISSLTTSFPELTPCLPIDRQLLSYLFFTLPQPLSQERGAITLIYSIKHPSLLGEGGRGMRQKTEVAFGLVHEINVHNS